MDKHRVWNWGIISTGRIAGALARGLSQAASGRLVAVASRAEDKAKRFAEEHGPEVRAHGSYEALLADPDVEVVYIATPHPSHVEWAVKAAAAGKHILCEKPVGLNQAEVMQAIEAAARHDVFFMEAFMYRCQPQVPRMREIVQAGTLGEIQLIEAVFSFRCKPDPASRLFSSELGGGGILDVGCYCTSMARLVAGAALGLPCAEPVSVTGGGKRHPETGVDEYASGVLVFDRGIVAEIACGVNLARPARVLVRGTEGVLYVHSPWFGAGEGGKSLLEIERAGKPAEKIEVEAPAGLYALEIDEVGRSIDRRESPAMPWADSLGNAATLDRWRQAVGVLYETERPGGIRRPRLRLAPAGAGAPRISRAELAGLAKPVSRLAMGCMFDAGVFKIPHGFALLDYFFELGGNCVDTAFIYGGGNSDRFIGDWMKSRGARQETVVLAKGAHTPFCDPKNLNEQLLITLDRLQTDYADIYMMHRDNLDVPVGEFVDALNEHVRAGRIRLFGGSNWSRERIDEANAYARAKGLQGFTVLSNNLSLARMVEPVWEGCLAAKGREWREWLQREKIAEFAWSSQARGFFVRGDRGFAGDKELVRCWYSEDNFERLRRARDLAAKKGTEPIHIAAAWVLHQPFQAFALVGPQTLAEIRSCVQSLQVTLTPEEAAWLDLESEEAAAPASR